MSVGLVRAFGPVRAVRDLLTGVRFFATHARLVLAMSRRDLTQRYAGQAIGSIWVIGHPLFLTLLYIFIFGVVFKVKVGGTVELPLDFTAYLLSGLIPWLTFQAALNASCVSIVSNTGLVKQFVFPLEILPAKDVVTSMVVWGVGMATFALYVLATHGAPFGTWLLLPVLLIFQLLAMTGLALIVSALTVFFRDLKDFVQLFTTVGLFMMPVVYLPEMVPAAFRPILYANPFSYAIWSYQDALYFGRIEHPVAWIVFGAGSIVVFATGFRLFSRLKPLFASVL
jgi:lipopolysaccharide transport system permease protein